MRKSDNFTSRPRHGGQKNVFERAFRKGGDRQRQPFQNQDGKNQRDPLFHAGRDLPRARLSARGYPRVSAGLKGSRRKIGVRPPRGTYLRIRAGLAEKSMEISGSRRADARAADGQNERRRFLKISDGRREAAEGKAAISGGSFPRADAGTAEK